MDTNRLHQFHTLYHTGNFRRAAEILGISHSGLSKSMASLEAELKKKLFIQAGRGIAFTDSGHQLAPKIPEFLSQLSNLLVSDSTAAAKSLKVGTFEVFSTYFAKLLGPVLEEFELEFHELIPGKMERALLRREIDLAITYEPIPISGVEHLKVSEVEMGIFVKSGTFKGVNTLDIPFAAPLIPVEGSPTGLKGLDSWPDHKIDRTVKFRVDLMETAISLARNGHCAVFIPTFVARLHNELVKDEYQLTKRPLPAGMKAIKRKVYIVKRESTLEDSKLKKIAKHLRAL